MRREDAFNAALGKALCKFKPQWKKSIKIEETQTLLESKGLHIDILIADKELMPVAIETSYVKGDADSDAIARLGKTYEETHDTIRTAIAVELDPHYRKIETLTKKDTLKYAIHQTTSDGFRRFPKSGFISGTYEDIGEIVNSISMPKEDIEKIAECVGASIKSAANHLEKIPTRDHTKIPKAVFQHSKISGLRTVAILWLNAYLVQHALQNTRKDIPNKSTDIKQCIAAWNKILEINWNGVFRPAIDVLTIVQDTASAEVTNALQLLYDAVQKIVTSKIGREINIGAELFPILAEDRKESAAFYTQPAAAEFLAAMTIRPDMADWSDKDLFNKFKLADFTCGTGTLLRFGYRQVRNYHVRNGGTKSSLEKMHAMAMKNGIYGLDISPIAAHLTASSLAIESHLPYQDTNIGWVQVGNDNRTGSIEYIKTSSVVDLLSQGFGTSVGKNTPKKKNIKKYSSITINDHAINICLLNPPYSRTGGGAKAFDVRGFQEDERKACQTRWGELIKKHPCEKTAGMAATFLCIADKKIAPKGRIGFVLPRTAAFANSWQKTRNMIEENYEDITAVVIESGKALGRNALSADTHMEEMFLIATKKDSVKSHGNISNNENTKDKHSALVKCVTLYSPIMRIGEAKEIAKAVCSSELDGQIMLGEDAEIGVSHSFRTKNGKPWSLLGIKHTGVSIVLNGFINGSIMKMDNCKIKSIPMTTIEQLFDVGPTHHLIGHVYGKKHEIGPFKFTEITTTMDTEGPNRALWSAQSENQKKLIVTPTHKGAIYDNSTPTQITAALEKRSILFYSKKTRWTTQKLVAAVTKNPVMGGGGWVCLMPPSSKKPKKNKITHKTMTDGRSTLNGNLSNATSKQIEIALKTSPRKISVADEDLFKAFALWSNSIYGMMLYWAWGDRTQSGRSRMQVKQIKTMPCPDFTKIPSNSIKCAASEFDKLSKEDLQPAYMAFNDKTRKKINQNVFELLFDLSKYDHEALTQAWCNESSIKSTKNIDESDDADSDEAENFD